MIKIVFFTVLILFLVLLQSPDRETKNEAANFQNPSPSAKQKRNTVALDHNGKEYSVNWFIASDPKKISLKSNLKDKSTSREIVQSNQCSSFISGGFYTKEDKHIGLFIEDKKEIQKFNNHSLFNGFVGISDSNVEISNSVPSNTKFALQSGPILIQSEQNMTLSLKNDEPARRMVISKSKSGEIIFSTFFGLDNPYKGPLLSELTTLVRNFQSVLGADITDSLNLDGGIHSAFYTEGELLSEISPIGSYFCVKN